MTAKPCRGNSEDPETLHSWSAQRLHLAPGHYTAFSGLIITITRLVAIEHRLGICELNRPVRGAGSRRDERSVQHNQCNQP
jgi:hypothetical protein